MSKSKKSTTDNIYIPKSEREALLYFNALKDYIRKRGGQYLRSEDGSLHVIVDGERVPLAWSRDNHALGALMLDACYVTMLTQGAQAAIQRLQIYARKQASGLKLRRFSALSEDKTRLYIPTKGGLALRITRDGLCSIQNGQNDDSLWVEHPYQHPVDFRPGSSGKGLALFESLLVDTQACCVPALRWFVAMHEGLFPYIRDICRARFLLVHTGGTQQGKTTGAQRFTVLHGLGDVKGDCTVAAAANLGDIGLLVLDNKEQANFSQGLIDHCLFLSTGAERVRSQTDGTVRKSSSSRPVAVITSIEGVFKAELQARCVEIPYEIMGPKTGRDDIEDEIQRHRDEILFALMPVLQAWVATPAAESKVFWTECPLPNFDRHITVLAELLDAYAEVARKPEGWAEQIIAEWVQFLRRQETEVEDDLEGPILQILEENVYGIIPYEEVVYGGKHGRLYRAEATTWLNALKKWGPRDLSLPKNGSGFSRRLHSAQFRRMTLLVAELAPEFPKLKRTAKKRPIGLFVPKDDVTDVTVDDASESEASS